MSNYNEGRKQSTYKYREKNIKRIPLDVQIEDYEAYKRHAEAVGESLNGYIKKAVQERIEREN